VKTAACAAVAACLSVGLAVPVAAAQDEQAVSRDEEVAASLDAEARATFEAGQLAMQNGRFEVALSRFREAHELSGRPILLFNIGVTAERLRRDAEALEAFQRYLEEVPDAPNRMEVEGRIRVLLESVEGSVDPEAPADPTPADPAVTDPSASAVDEPESGGRLWTWIALAAGAVSLTVGGISWAAANGEQQELIDECFDRDGCTDEEVDGGWDERGIDGKVAMANLFGGIGLAALVLGGVLFFVEGGDGGDEPGAQVGIGPGGVALRGSF